MLVSGPASLAAPGCARRRRRTAHQTNFIPRGDPMKCLRLPASARLSLAPLSSAVLLLCIPGGVHAQGDALEEITVTGSRIVRRDFEANSPILTVEEEAFDNTMSVGIETIMNQL